MNLGYVIIYVADVPETLSFYEKAFGIKQRFLHESNQYAEMETGQTALAFANENFVTFAQQLRRNRTTEQSPGVEIAFVADDVEKAFNHAISAGATEVLKPTQKPWGQIVSYVRDLNGFLVEICSAIEV
ncbi:hypothetical protein PNK_1166 [Candidatus Protochlamydia naegleriophila]|uniref:VOC domain-containing protein n=1 Tax=Candidatus Protochlamydia naegleriophila TaxID=389348 RepID=A0A0U5JEH7_9BACT|nr:VOC family protein [Candidatus Protochlamydia naegleriophila]CUI16783.1 hypothetical protein PNK_1166 [Candidatus Protochlamydia naegleriophila]